MPNSIIRSSERKENSLIGKVLLFDTKNVRNCPPSDTIQKTSGRFLLNRPLPDVLFRVLIQIKICTS